MSSDLAFRMQIFIAGPPEDVWRILTSDGLAARWWDPVRSSEWRVGGRVIYDVADEGRIDCDILEMDPPRRLVTTFDCDVYPDHPPTRVTWEIEPVEGGSLLRMVHDRFPSHDRGLDDVCRHWPQIIADLKKLVESEVASGAANRG
jgi:uncharacterized protein YndB with AHSA1/START domain